MTPSAVFFLGVLALQIGFTGSLVWIVARRFPARVPLYRFIAPAAVPLLFLGMIGSIAWQAGGAGHDPQWAMRLAPVALAYAILWMVGVIWASLVVRWVRG